MEIARKHKLKMIEDCAQSYLTRYQGRLTGTIGDYAASAPMTSSISPRKTAES